MSPANTGTSPADPDSDGDGADDGLEVDLGTDPTNPLSVPCTSLGGCATVCAVDGDPTGDGLASITDVQCTILANLWELSDQVGPAPECLAGPPPVADLDCNGAVNVTDVILIVKLVLGDPFAPQIDANQDGCVDTCEVPAGPVCGDGTCDAGETTALCPADCPPEPEPCGDGTCDAATETFTTCPADCPAPPGPLECASATCGPQVNACLANAGCTQIALCAANCGTSATACLFACTAGQPSASVTLALNLLGCAQASGCF